MVREAPSEEFIKASLGNNYRLLTSVYAGIFDLHGSGALKNLYPRINLDTAFQLAFSLRQIKEEHLRILTENLELSDLITELTTAIPVKIETRDFLSAAYCIGAFSRHRNKLEAKKQNPYSRAEELKNIKDFSDEDYDEVFEGLKKPKMILITGKDPIPNKPYIQLPFYDHFRTEDQKNWLSNQLSSVLGFQRNDTYGQQSLI